MMIPQRIRQIAKTTAIACAVGVLCFFAYSRAAGLAFAVTSAWMIANLLIWTIVIRLALNPKDEKPSVAVLLLALSVKLLLLIGGVVALRIFAPYQHEELYAIIAGVSSVLIVAFLKALGSKVAAMATSSSVPTEKKRAAKV